MQGDTTTLQGIAAFSTMQSVITLHDITANNQNSCYNLN
jgi:hypothetical protein